MSQAVFWRIQLEEHVPGAAAGLKAWIAESAPNNAAWLRVQFIWGVFSENGSALNIAQLRSDSLNWLEHAAVQETQTTSLIIESASNGPDEVGQPTGSVITGN